MADRSLAFFATIANQQSNTDPLTGMGMSNISVQYDITKYDKANPQDTSKQTQETKNVNYNVIGSLQNSGQFINYLGNSTTNDYKPLGQQSNDDSDIKLSSIIKWTNDKPAMSLNVFNFAYLKDFNVYPANKLMILRRFNGPVNDDIFSSSMIPTNTMATYYHLDKSPIKISFNEEWTKTDDTFIEVLQDVIGIKFESGSGDNKSALSKVAGSPIGQDMLQIVGQKLGIISEGGLPYGDPNIIYESMIRKTSKENSDSSFEMESGLTSKINIDFETTYIFREIGGIDAKAAMLDIIANAVHMGTSNARFYITGNAASSLSSIIHDMETGNVDALFKEILGALSGLIKDLASKIASAGATIITDASKTSTVDAILGDAKALGSMLLKTRYSRYKWKLQGAIASLSGMYTAPWHITIGNPKFPWFCCGNLVVEDVTLDAGGELGYNDMFTELTVKIRLQSGRSLGADELTSLFNNGRGRIYDTPEKLQSLNVPNDQSYKIPGIEATGSQNVKQDQTTINNQADTDQKNVIPNTTDFSFGNTSEDPNLNPQN